MKFILVSLLFHSAFPSASFRKFSANNDLSCSIVWDTRNVIFLFIMLIDAKQGLLK